MGWLEREEASMALPFSKALQFPALLQNVDAFYDMPAKQVMKYINPLLPAI
jgi:hypothetical protein